VRLNLRSEHADNNTTASNMDATQDAASYTVVTNTPPAGQGEGSKDVNNIQV
jgi:hypothetical protein